MIAAAEETIELVENLQAPELFASIALSCASLNGAVTITLGSTRRSHAVSDDGATVLVGPPRCVVVGRIVMPQQIAYEMAVSLFDHLKAQGVDPLGAGGGRLPLAPLN